jgi:hypothetical protein
MAHPEPGGDRTSYALVKYGIILIIVIVVLFFLVRYLIPALTGAGDEGPAPGPSPAAAPLGW